MIVDSLKAAHELVDEIGANNIEAVFRFIHAIYKKTCYVVYTKNQYIDIYTICHCTYIEKIFESGEWMDWEKEFAE